MDDTIIRVDNLGKRYRIGATDAAPRRGLGRLAGALASPFGYLWRMSRPPTEAETLWVLRDVSFAVRRGEILGIIGRNGAGKSTLLKIMSRITEPTRGRVTIRGRVGSLLEVGTGFHHELTGRENIYLSGAILGMRRRDIAARFDEIVAFSGLERFLDTPIKCYSSGMQVRLGFAVAAHLDPGILLVDEVLAVGDMEFQRRCLDKMAEVAGSGRTILFVTHNMFAMESLCTRAVLLEGGRVAAEGSPAEVLAHYESRVAHELHGAEAAGPSHVLWDDGAGGGSPGRVGIRRIEMLELDGEPKTRLATWDAVRLRLHLRCAEMTYPGGLVLSLRTPHNVPALTLETPRHIRIPAGDSFVDCVVRRFPLAAGDYVVGASVTVPWVEILWHRDDLARLRVGERDVYASGHPPVVALTLVAAEQEWVGG